MKKMFIDKGMTVKAMAIQLGVPQGGFMYAQNSKAYRIYNRKQS